MRFLFWTLLLVLQPCLVYAIHKTDVGVVDWYKKLVGVPLSGNIVTAPTFRRVGGKSVILTATTSNALAALSPGDGHVGESVGPPWLVTLVLMILVAWRYIFEADDRIAGFYTHDDGEFGSI